MINKKFFAVLIFLILTLSFLIQTDVHASVISETGNRIAPEEMPPKIVFNNSSNLVPLWNATLNHSGDNATINMTSIWSSSIYATSNGTLLWTDTNGTVLARYSPAGIPSNYGSPYSTSKYSGPIVSITAASSNTGHGIGLLTLLSESGFVFTHPIGSGSWSNVTSSWHLPLSSFSNTWTSAISYVGSGKNNYIFDFVSLNGSIYQYQYKHSKSKWLYEAPTDSSLEIISAVLSYSGTYIYGVSYNGTVYVLDNSWKTYDNTGLNGTVGITDDETNKGIYILNIKNSTTLYESPNGVGQLTGTFNPVGTGIFSEGTASAITYDYTNNLFWTIQTNGTIADSTNATAWSYSNNLLSHYYYTPVMSIQSNSSSAFYLIASYLKSSGLDNMLIFNLSLDNSSSLLQFSYYYGVLKIPDNVATLSPSASFYVNITLMPNSAYNSQFCFYVLSTPSNYHGVVVSYAMNVNLVNHFSFIPLQP